MALLTAADTGNALRTQARPESQTLVNLFRYFGGVAGEFKGAVLPAGDDQLQYTRREPLGVVAGILPWNSPLMIAGMKTPASLGGRQHPDPQDRPGSAADHSEDGRDRVRVPAAGRAQCGHRQGSVIGEALLMHPDVDKVSFTGSTGVGMHVAEDRRKAFGATSLSSWAGRARTSSSRMPRPRRTSAPPPTVC